MTCWPSLEESNVGKCETCKFQVDLTCRRYPPVASVIVMPVKSPLGQMSMNPMTVCAWPSIQEDFWCGEYAPALLS